MALSVNFFATRDDLLLGFRNFEARNSVKYVVAGLFDSPAPEAFLTLASIPTLGKSLHGHRSSETTYLVLPADSTVNIESIPQRRGGTKYFIGAPLNPTGFVFSPAGEFTGQIIIDGSAGTTSENEVAIRLCDEFIKNLRAGFVQVQEYFVGPHVIELMKHGYRLTMSAQTPKSFDLRPPPGTM
jgi:hypothetical protein